MNQRFLPIAASVLIATAVIIGCVDAQNQPVTPPTEQPAPSGWRVETLKTGLERPWSINFAPDGRLLMTTRNTGEVQALTLETGAVQRYPVPLQNFRVEGEGGLLGMELASDFNSSNTVYLCYSYWKDGQKVDSARRNRLSSFTVDLSGLSGEKVLLDDLLGWSNHNGCRVVLSPDNTKLFVTMGDAANSQKAQDLASRAGKTYRINLDGSIPTDNPFTGSAVWSLGHRNAQGLAFQPGTGLLWSTEHGPDVKDELNVVKKGRNYGWPVSNCQGTAAESGACSLKDYQAAVKSYDPQITVAMSDMAFYSSAAFPAWKGNLFFVTLKTGRLYRLEVSGETVSKDEILIDNEYGRLRDIAVGQDGFIYLSTDAGTNSSILRVRPK